MEKRKTEIFINSLMKSCRDILGTGYFCRYHDNRQIECETYFLNHKQCGLNKWYDYDSFLDRTQTRKLNVLNGIIIEF